MYIVDVDDNAALSLLTIPNKSYLKNSALNVLKNTIEAESSSEKEDEQTTVDDNVVENDDIDFEDAADPEFIPGPRILQQLKPTARMRVCLITVAETARKTGISVRAASQVTCALMKDLKIISKENKSKAIDKYKIQRALKRRQTELQVNDRQDFRNLISLYFDGKKDVTLVRK